MDTPFCETLEMSKKKDSVKKPDSSEKKPDTRVRLEEGLFALVVAKMGTIGTDSPSVAVSHWLRDYFKGQGWFETKGETS
jgi:hypothetical protein